MKFTIESIVDLPDIPDIRSNFQLSHQPDNLLTTTFTQDNLIRNNFTFPDRGIYDDIEFLGKTSSPVETQIDYVRVKNQVGLGAFACYNEFETGESYVHIPLPFKTDFPIEVISSQWNETTSGTLLQTSVTARVGTSLIAVVTTRSETTFSQGWEVVDRVLNFSTSSQNLYILQKEAESEIEFITVNQAIAGRIYTQLISFNTKVFLSTLWSYSSGNVDNVSSLAVPDKEQGQLILWALSANLWGTSSPYGKWQTNPNDLKLYSAPTDVQDRQAVFFDDGNGAAISRTFTSDSSGNTGAGALMMELSKAEILPIVGSEI